MSRQSNWDAVWMRAKNRSEKIQELRDLCKELGHTLYSPGTNDEGDVVYRVREVPTFRALFRRE